MPNGFESGMLFAHNFQLLKLLAQRRQLAFWLQIKAPSSVADTRAVCDTSKSKSGFNGYTDNIRTALLSSLPIASSCTEKSENGMSSVYVLDILNHTE